MTKDQIDLSNHLESFPPAYLAAKTEADLAVLQQFQIGNTCTLHCISSAFQILTGRVIQPAELAEELDALPFFTRLPYRSWNNGPVTPFQQVALIRKLAKEMNLPLSVRLMHPSLNELITMIRQSGITVLVTIGWLRKFAPVITLGEETASYGNPSPINWHTMLAAAYDPLHKDVAGNWKPWGFINSWVDHGSHLFWMTNHDFLRAWSFFTPFGGIRPAVVVERS